MSDFFLELYSEEIPASLQKDARDGILKLFKEIFEKNEFIYKFAESYSTPNRLVFYISGIPRVISKKAYKIKGPRVDSSKQAIEGFARSNQIEVKNLIQENNDKGNFYFAKIESKKIFIQEELANIIPEVLKKFPVVIIDNSNSDELEKIILNYKNINLIKSSKNLGYGVANNLGVSKATTPFILIVNPDILINEDAISELFKNFLNDPQNIGILGPSLYDENMNKRTNGTISYLDKLNGVKVSNLSNNINIEYLSLFRN